MCQGTALLIGKIERMSRISMWGGRGRISRSSRSPSATRRRSLTTTELRDRGHPIHRRRDAAPPHHHPSASSSSSGNRPAPLPPSPSPPLPRRQMSGIAPSHPVARTPAGVSMRTLLLRRRRGSLRALPPHQQSRRHTTPSGRSHRGSGRWWPTSGLWCSRQRSTCRPLYLRATRTTRAPRLPRWSTETPWPLSTPTSTPNNNMSSPCGASSPAAASCCPPRQQGRGQNRERSTERRRRRWRWLAR
mmetsp:Transcript_24394/g.70385  ORF Transcript_24394/g.70385 Transcript_24394/m.70385 type:complete len:246 (-) Transcript_24394:1046-1783(-)